MKKYYNYEKAQALVDHGASITDAAKQNGIPPNSFYGWRSNQKKKATPKSAYSKRIVAKPQVIQVAEAPRRFLAIIGTASELQAFARNL